MADEQITAPRVVAAGELVAGWPIWARESFAYWMAGAGPDYVDRYDAIVRRLESSQRDRERRAPRRPIDS